jgi:hypothetical protein
MTFLYLRAFVRFDVLLKFFTVEFQKKTVTKWSLESYNKFKIVSEFEGEK